MKYLIFFYAMFFTTWSQAHTGYEFRTSVLHELMHAAPVLVIALVAALIIKSIRSGKASNIKNRK